MKSPPTPHSPLGKDLGKLQHLNGNAGGREKGPLLMNSLFGLKPPKHLTFLLTSLCLYLQICFCWVLLLDFNKTQSWYTGMYVTHFLSLSYWRNGVQIFYRYFNLLLKCFILGAGAQWVSWVGECFLQLSIESHWQSRGFQSAGDICFVNIFHFLFFCD